MSNDDMLRAVTVFCILVTLTSSQFIILYRADRISRYVRWINHSRDLLLAAVAAGVATNIATNLAVTPGLYVVLAMAVPVAGWSVAAAAMIVHTRDDHTRR